MSEFLQYKPLLEDEEGLRTLYPQLIYKNYRYIDDPSLYLLVDDISMGDLTILCEDIKYIELLNMQSLVDEIIPTLIGMLSSYDSEQVLLIFPGGGGSRVQACIPDNILTRYSRINLQVQRVKDLITGLRTPFMTDEEQQKLYVNLSDKVAAVVLDDAINEGNTLQYIRYACGIEGLSWISASPIIFSPLPQQDKRRTASSIEGFDKVMGAQVVEGSVNPVRLNFLSSLLKRNLQDTNTQNMIINNMKNKEDAEILINSLMSLQRFMQE